MLCRQVSRLLTHPLVVILSREAFGIVINAWLQLAYA